MEINAIDYVITSKHSTPQQETNFILGQMLHLMKEGVAMHSSMMSSEAANNDIDHTVRNLPTTQKAVANAINKSGIANDPDGCRYLYMDSCYAAPKLFAMAVSTWNIQGVGTFKANRMGFASDELQLDIYAE
eukprot:8494444-Ditylum_brightwellii.AAC.1